MTSGVEEVLRAFTSTTAEGHPVLAAAAGLAAQHRSWAAAHQLIVDPHAGDHVVAAATRVIAATNTAVAVLIERVDSWAGATLTVSRTGFVHTETLGQLLDRLADLFTHWRLLTEADGDTRPQAGQALYRLSELSTAYDDLLADLHTGRRRLPGCHTPTVPIPARA